MIFTSAVVVSLYLFLSILYFGSRKPGYRHIKHTISELAETGAVNERIVNFGVFLVVGLSILLLCIYVHFNFSNVLASTFIGVSGSVAIGYLVAVFFPCDPGCPLEGSTKQFIHNAGGFVEYVGGGYFIFKIPELQVLAPVVVGAGLLMSLTFLFRWRGLIQRVAEISLFASLIWIGLQLSF